MGWFISSPYRLSLWQRVGTRFVVMVVIEPVPQSVAAHVVGGPAIRPTPFQHMVKTGHAKRTDSRRHFQQLMKW
jgi:hypothetical protein